MTNTNYFVEIGNVTRDINPEMDFAFIGNGSARLNFSIAVNRAKKKDDQWIDEVYYLEFTCFGKLAENMKNFLQKGTKVCVTGYIKQDRWTKDDKNFSKLVLIADSVELLSKKDGGSSNSAPTFKPADNAASTPVEENSGDFPEDIPF
jgi:single-strand DNA-binding protein